MDQEKSSARKVSSLPDLAASAFSLILSLRTSANYGRESELRKRIGGYLDQIDKEGRDAGIAREDLEAAKYPLVAFIDETILNSRWEGRESWRERPLQLDLYGETVAGERFFERLEKLRARGESKADQLEIYYLCLALGFEGKYKLAGVERLRRLTDEVRRELGYSRSKLARAAIAPNGRRRESNKKGVDDGLPIWKIAGASAGGLLLLFLLLYLLIGQTEGGALQKLQALAG
jgi:type VI secretion system protein ImpK